MYVREVLEKRSYDEIVETLASLSDSSDRSSVEQLQEFLKIRDGNTFSKHTTPRIVCLTLLQKGMIGIKTLFAVFPDAPGQAITEELLARFDGLLNQEGSEETYQGWRKARLHRDPR